MKPVISGIQQIGIGIPDVHAAFKWYRENLGMDIPIFEEAAEANLMLPYTGGKPHERHAILAINIQGGGGFEIWQYTSRTPEAPKFEPKLGDYGIYAARIKSRNVAKAYEVMKAKGEKLVGEVQKGPDGKPHFFVKDPYGNLFQIVEGKDFFGESDAATGGPAGAIIAVSDMDKSMEFYKDILGYDKVLYDESGNFDDLKEVPGGEGEFRRVLLTHSQEREGGFSRMFGSSQIELFQLKGGSPKKIFENRFWGDLGYIHLCFDIRGMEELRKLCAEKGHPFTVDSQAAMGTSFDMGEAAGLFSYIEDPDGTLIEFVETHKVPIMKKFNWYINMLKRDARKPLPNWMLKALRFNRVK